MLVNVITQSLICMIQASAEMLRIRRTIHTTANTLRVALIHTSQLTSYRYLRFHFFVHVAVCLTFGLYEIVSISKCQRIIIGLI